MLNWLNNSCVVYTLALAVSHKTYGGRIIRVEFILHTFTRKRSIRILDPKKSVTIDELKKFRTTKHKVPLWLDKGAVPPKITYLGQIKYLKDYISCFRKKV